MRTQFCGFFFLEGVKSYNIVSSCLYQCRATVAKRARVSQKTWWVSEKLFSLTRGKRSNKTILAKEGSANQWCWRGKGRRIQSLASSATYTCHMHHLHAGSSKRLQTSRMEESSKGWIIQVSNMRKWGQINVKSYIFLKKVFFNLCHKVYCCFIYYIVFLFLTISFGKETKCCQTEYICNNRCALSKWFST